MVLANNMLRGQADGYCQNSFPLHQRKIEFVLPAAFPTLFSWKIFLKKNAAAIQIRFEKRLQGQTATDVPHG